MGIAKPPAKSQQILIASTEGQNIDQWQSININKFVPDALQEVLDKIQELIDTVTEVIQFALELAKLVSALVSALFDLLRAIIDALLADILALLDLFPKLEAGIYMLWIPTDFGGVDYYTHTFRSSLADRKDLRRPPQDPDFPMTALFFMWGAPWFDATRLNQVTQIGDSFSALFDLKNIASQAAIVPVPLDLSVEKGFFVKPKTLIEEVTNSLRAPDNVIINGVLQPRVNSTDTLTSIRTTIKNIKRTSDKPGVSHSITWEMPKTYGAFSRSNTDYTQSNSPNEDGTETFIFTKVIKKLVGIDILRADNLKVLERNKLRMRSETDNPYSFKGESSYDDTEESFIENTTLIHRKLSSFPGTDFTIHFPPDPEKVDYYYAAAFVYAISYSQVFVTKQTNGDYEVTRVITLNKNNQDQSTLVDQSALDGVDFLAIKAEDIEYPKDDDYEERTAVGEPTGAVTASRTTMIAPGGGTPPDWIAFKAIEDMIPEIGRFIDKAKTLINNIVDGVLDDANALQEWIEEGLSSIEDTLKDAQDLADSLNALLFPPMLGVHFMNLFSSHGMPNIVSRYEKSLTLGLKSEDGAFNPLLLDQGFRQNNPAEFNKRVDIPAYDTDHLTGGFILAFQEPAVEAFIKDLLGIGDSFGDNFQKILNDSRLRIRNIKIPEFEKFDPPSHPFVSVRPPLNPNSYMVDRSNWKSGADKTADLVNDDGDVEIKTAAGPYENTGAPKTLAIVCEDGVIASTVLPKGTLTAAQVAALLKEAGLNTGEVDDGSFVINGKELTVSPCSKEAAELLGIDPTTSLSAANQNINTEGEEFEYGDGDFLLEFVNNGRPTLEMKQASVPIFQLNDFDELLLGPNTHLLKFDIEDELGVIVDVTGNAGTNPINKSPEWVYEAVFPLTLVTEDIPNSIVGTDKFNFQITGTPVSEGIDETVNEITLRPITYNTIHDLSGEILRALGEAGYPLGVFSTQANATEDGASFRIVDTWGHNSTTTLAITAVVGNAFLTTLTSSVVSPGTDKTPYLIDDIVTTLNAAFTKDYFTNENGKIRITGTIVGKEEQITVYSALSNQEYSLVALALFGLTNTTVIDMLVKGIGVSMTSNEYYVEMLDQTHMCTEFQTPTSQNMTVELETEQYTVEIIDPTQQEYLIEFVG